jgi:hypothetical protein
MRTLNRTTEEFVRHHRLLIERTKNDPARLLEAANEFPDLAACIDRLHKIDQAVEQHRDFGKRPFIVQAHSDFARLSGTFVPVGRLLTTRSAINAMRKQRCAYRRNICAAMEFLSSGLGTT